MHEHVIGSTPSFYGVGGIGDGDWRASASQVRNSNNLSTRAPASSRESHLGMCGRRRSVHISSRFACSRGGRLKREFAEFHHLLHGCVYIECARGCIVTVTGQPVLRDRFPCRDRACGCQIRQHSVDACHGTVSLRVCTWGGGGRHAVVRAPHQC